MVKKLVVTSLLAWLAFQASGAETPLPLVQICSDCDIERAEDEMNTICQLGVDGEEPSLTLFDARRSSVHHFYCEAGLLIKEGSQQHPELIQALASYTSNWAALKQKLAKGYRLEDDSAYQTLEEAMRYPDAFPTWLAHQMTMDARLKEHADAMGEAIALIRSRLQMEWLWGIANELTPFDSTVTLPDGSRVGMSIPPINDPWGSLDVKVAFPQD